MKLYAYREKNRKTLPQNLCGWSRGNSWRMDEIFELFRTRKECKKAVEEIVMEGGKPFNYEIITFESKN